MKNLNPYLVAAKDRRCDANVRETNCNIEEVGNEANKTSSNGDPRAGGSATAQNGCTASVASSKKLHPEGESEIIS